MRITGQILFAVAWVLPAAVAQNAPAQSANRTDIYHIHFAKAALGKAGALGEYLKTRDPGAPMPEHTLVLRHQVGQTWDFVAIEHLGPKATVEVPQTPPASAVRDLYEWHTDHFVAGPPWAEFARAMGLDAESKARSQGSLYVVSTYRAAPGHRDELEKIIIQPPGGGVVAADLIIMQHLQGGPWQFFGLTRFKSWHDYAINGSTSVSQTAKSSDGWNRMREHAAYHDDTITDRVAP